MLFDSPPAAQTADWFYQCIYICIHIVKCTVNVLPWTLPCSQSACDCTHDRLWCNLAHSRYSRCICTILQCVTPLYSTLLAPLLSSRQMLFCRVTLGKSFLQFSAMKMAHAPPGHHSVIGRPSVNGLAYAEYVIYRGEQVSGHLARPDIQTDRASWQWWGRCTPDTVRNSNAGKTEFCIKQVRSFFFFFFFILFFFSFFLDVEGLIWTRLLSPVLFRAKIRTCGSVCTDL